MENLIYVFVPFRVSGREAFFNAAAGGGDGLWEDNSKQIRSYFFKHLTDKVVAQPKGEMDRRCCVFLGLKEKRMGRKGDRPTDEWDRACDEQWRGLGFSLADRFHLTPPSYLVELYPNVDMAFRIESLKLAAFKTGIGLVAFGVTFEETDPMALARAEYLLKLAAEDLDQQSMYYEKNSLLRKEGETMPTNFTALSRRVIGTLLETVVTEPDFGFYCQKPRAHLMSLVMVPEKSDGEGYQKELYYLRNGFGDGYMYPDGGDDGTSVVLGDPNIRWGVSNEVTCCLVRPDLFPQSRNFIMDSFRYKFCREYLFMYLWLLHQKYALYAFLTDISKKGLDVGGAGRLRQLRDYKTEFAFFESNFVFGRVADVPQYQQLYDAVYGQFALKTMDADVREPLVLLEDIAKEEQQRHETRVTMILAGVAIFSIFSAYIDSYEFIGKFFGGDLARHPSGVRLCQLACVGVITFALVIGLVFLFGCYAKRRRS